MAPKVLQDYSARNQTDDVLMQVIHTSSHNVLRWPGFGQSKWTGFSSALGRKVAPFILIVIDYFVVLLAIYCAFVARSILLPQQFPLLSPIQIPDRQIYFLMLPVLCIGFICYEGLYVKRLPFWQSSEKIFKSCFFATAIGIVIMYFSGAAKEVSRLLIGVAAVLIASFLISARYITKRVLVACGIWRKPIVIVGCGKTVDMLARAFDDEPGMGYQIVGLIDDAAPGQPLKHPYEILGTFDNLENAIIQSGVSEVVIAMPHLKRRQLLDLVDRIRPLVKDLTIVPDLYGLPLSNLEVNTFFNQKAVLLRVKNNLLIKSNYFVKRFFDILAGTVILIAVTPFLLILALLIKLDSPGPVFHTGKRIGKKGREFKCYKFRTMYVNEAQILKRYLSDNPVAQLEWERFAKLRKYDPRVTKVGNWMRRFSLDELPQIINVMKGEMSLVGPRPYLPREKDRMTEYMDVILETVPGITGLWQVNGRNDVEFVDRLALDSWYVRNWSFWLDLTLLLKTAGVVFGRKGAY